MDDLTTELDRAGDALAALADGPGQAAAASLETAFGEAGAGIEAALAGRAVWRARLLADDAGGAGGLGKYCGRSCARAGGHWRGYIADLQSSAIRYGYHTGRIDTRAFQGCGESRRNRAEVHMSLAGFHEGRLPVPPGFGSTSGPVWQTETLVLSSGREVRNACWSRPQRRWEVVTPPLSVEAFDSLVSFFNARRGRLAGFRFRDPAAFSSAASGMAVSPSDQALGIGDGTRTTFQLIMADGGIEHPVLKPVAGSVHIGVNGAELLSGWEVDELTGEVAFDVAPEEGAILTAGFEYDWPVRFDTDALEVSFETAGSGRVVSLPLVEIF